MTIGERLLMYRSRHELTQKEMAKILDVTVFTVSRIERGRRIPGRVTRTKIELLLEKDDKN